MTIYLEPDPSQWMPAQPAGRPMRVGTGHQVWLWHPGILAKDMAARAVVQSLDDSTPPTTGEVVHLMVEHDPLDRLGFDVPVVRGDQVVVKFVELGQIDPKVPMGWQPAIPAGDVLARLVAFEATLDHTERDQARASGAMTMDLAGSVARLKEAIEDGSEQEHSSLSRQVGAWLNALMRPWVGELSLVWSNDLLAAGGAGGAEGAGWGWLERMLREPVAMAQAYDGAVRDVPEAGISPLGRRQGAVELPVWRVAWGQQRQTVWAMLDGSGSMTDGRLSWHLGQVASGEISLAPKALFQTAIMRDQVVDLFIHGRGGAVYDRATERWWETWTGRRLRSMAMASADLRLPLGVPVDGDPARVAAARWRLHHTQYNVDRLLGLTTPLATRKAALIRALPAMGDRWQKREAYLELQAINRQLCEDHPEAMAESQAGLASEEAALANRDAGRRRDWFFGLYPQEHLQGLAAELDARFRAGGVRGVGGLKEQR